MSPAGSRQDDDFGNIVFDPDNDWWCGQIDVGAGPVPLFVFAGLGGPSARQRELWRRMKPTLAATAAAIIADYVVEAGRRLAARDFTLDDVCLYPDDQHEHVESIWTYSLAGDPQGMWRFEVKAGKVVSGGRDD
jgi:hypothetical protein